MLLFFYNQQFSPSYILPGCAYNLNLPDLRQQSHVSPAPDAAWSYWSNYLELVECWARLAASIPQWARSHPRCFVASWRNHEETLNVLIDLIIVYGFSNRFKLGDTCTFFSYVLSGDSGISQSQRHLSRTVAQMGLSIRAPIDAMKLRQPAKAKATAQSTSTSGQSSSSDQPMSWLSSVAILLSFSPNRDSVYTL